MLRRFLLESKFRFLKFAIISLFNKISHNLFLKAYFLNCILFLDFIIWFFFLFVLFIAYSQVFFNELSCIMVSSFIGKLHKSSVLELCIDTFKQYHFLINPLKLL